MVAQRTEGVQPARLPRREDDLEYIVWVRGAWIKLVWSQMTRRQRELQIEAERRAMYTEQFGIYS